jgi:hypothetical protein
MSSIDSKTTMAATTTLPPPTKPANTNPSPSSSRYSKHGAGKLNRPKRQNSRSARQSTTPTPSIVSTSSSLSEVKHIFSSWIGNIRAGVSGAWIKAKGETETYLASQEGESRMQRRRNEVVNLREPTEKHVGGEEGLIEDVELGGGKRPATSDGTTLPALKKRSLSAKKLKKQKSMGKLPFGKSSISHPIPKNTPVSTAPTRAPPAPVYRATTGFIEHESEDGGLRTKVQSLETELSSLRAKLRWFEQSFGEIPADTLNEIKQDTTKKPRRSVFKEELGSVTSRSMNETSICDQTILPREVKALRGDGIDAITEESDADDTNGSEKVVIPPESTIKLIPPSPSTKSIASPPRPSRLSASPTKNHNMSPLSSPTKVHTMSPPSSPSKLIISPRSSPAKSHFISSPVEDKSVDLLETLSPIHPNIIPALIPRQSRPDLTQENLNNKLNDIAD